MIKKVLTFTKQRKKWMMQIYFKN